MSLIEEVDAFIHRAFPAGLLCDGYNFLWMRAPAQAALDPLDLQPAVDLICTHRPAWMLVAGADPSGVVAASRSGMCEEIFQSDYDTPAVRVPVWAVDLAATPDVARLAQQLSATAIAFASPHLGVVVNLFSRRVEAASRTGLNAVFHALGRPPPQPALREEVRQYMAALFPDSLKYGTDAYAPVWLNAAVRKEVAPAHLAAVFDLMSRERVWVIAVSDADPEAVLPASRVERLVFRDPIARITGGALASAPGWFAECAPGSPPIACAATWVNDARRLALIAPDRDVGLQRYSADSHALFAPGPDRLADFAPFIIA